MEDEKDLEWVHDLVHAILIDEARAVGDNDIAVHRMDKSESILRTITDGTNVIIESRKNQPFPSMGVITITGKEIRFIDSSGFLAAAKLASNIEVYSENGAVARIDFTFHGLTRKGGC